MTSEYNVRLNFDSATPVKTGLVFKSGDKGITFNFIIEELSTTGMTAKIAFYRSNGTSVEASITGSDEVYTYTTLGNEFAVPGLVVADVKFYDSNTQRVSSASFLFAVISDTLDGFGSGTDNYSDALEQALAALNAAEQAMEDYVAAYGNLTPLNPRGVYDAAETYKPSDCVSYGGTSWICMVECTGETPAVGTYWMKIMDAAVSGVTTFNGRAGEVVPMAGDYNIGDMGGITITTPTDGQALTYDGNSGDWINSTPASTASDITYDNTTSGLSATNVQNAIDENAASVDQINDNIGSIYATGATNTTGATITSGTYFYLDGTLVRALADIAVGTTFTQDTNYEEVTVGTELFSLRPRLRGQAYISSYAAALTALESIYNDLTDEEKARAYIVDNTEILRCDLTSSGYFTVMHVYIANSTAAIKVMNITNHTYGALNFASSSFSYNDMSSDSRSRYMYLYA